MLTTLTLLALSATVIAFAMRPAFADEIPPHDCLEGATMDMPASGDGSPPASPAQS